MKTNRNLAITTGALALMLAACGGGSVQVNERSEDNLRISPQALLDNLAAAINDPAETGKLLVRLKGDDSYRFDWPQFWVALAQRPIAGQLYFTQTKLLSNLATSHCAAFSDYAAFVLKVGGDVRVTIAQSLQCPNPVRPDTALKLAEAAGAPAEALDFLKREVGKAERSDIWANALAKHEGIVERIGRQAQQVGDASIYFETAMAFRAAIGVGGYPRSLASDLVGDASKVKTWFQLFPPDKGIALLAAILTESSELQLRAEKASAFMQAIADHLRSLEPSLLAEGLPQALAISARVCAHHALAIELASVDSILVAAEEGFRKLDPRHRYIAFSDWLSKRTTEAEMPYLHRFILRSATGKPLFGDRLRKDIHDSIASESHATQLTVLLNRSDVGTDGVENARWLDDACRLLEQHSIPAQTPSIKDLVGKMQTRLTAGCYTLPPGETVELKSEKPLSTSFATILRGTDQEPFFRSPYVSLGAVLLQTTKQHNSLEALPVPPEKNASTFPLLVGVALDHDTSFFKKGNHFFIFHFTERVAVRGRNETRESAVGYPGPNAFFESNQTPSAFIFVSQGGPGQLASPAQKGGLGDESFADVDHLRRWLETLVDNDAVKLTGPTRLEDSLSLQWVDDLLANARKTATGAIEILAVPGYPQQMDDEQRTKLVLACRQFLSKENLSNEEIDGCLRDRIIPSALTQIETVLLKSEKEGSVARTTLFPSLNTREFSLPAAGPGKKGADGTQGHSGQMKLSIGEKEANP
jgi:hypothetical protein